jgi:hypothetical protein
MHFSAYKRVTRYEKREMEALRESKSAQAPPLCAFDPKVIRLNILKTQPDDYEDQMKTFRELLPNLAMNSWDPKVLELLNNYHKSLLFPHNYGHNGENRKLAPTFFEFTRFPALRLQQLALNKPELQPKGFVERSEAVPGQPEQASSVV